MYFAANFCYQPFLSTGPRCCYAVFDNEQEFGSLISEPRASRYERYQIPFIDDIVFFFRGEEAFNQQYNNAISKFISLTF